MYAVADHTGMTNTISYYAVSVVATAAQNTSRRDRLCFVTQSPRDFANDAKRRTDSYNARTKQTNLRTLGDTVLAPNARTPRVCGLYSSYRGRLKPRGNWYNHGPLLCQIEHVKDDVFEPDVRAAIRMLAIVLVTDDMCEVVLEAAHLVARSGKK
jgi:hypothetical protein